MKPEFNMDNRHIIFVPGKNPKPLKNLHQSLLWKTLLEGIKRVSPDISDTLKTQEDCFKLIAWNVLYYHEVGDINTHLPWVNEVLNKEGPSAEDIEDAHKWHRKMDLLLYSTVDQLPILLRMLRGELKATANETNSYFHNTGYIASKIREKLKQQLRPLLESDQRILLIGHSLGSVIAYDTLWALSQLEMIPNKVDFLTLGSPLGMNYVQKRLLGHEHTDAIKYPSNIRNWINVAAEGDVTALDRKLATDFNQMLDLGVIESIEDHCEGIYNFYHDENGLNCHSDYGYLLIPEVANTISTWLQQAH